MISRAFYRPRLFHAEEGRKEREEKRRNKENMDGRGGEGRGREGKRRGRFENVPL